MSIELSLILLSWVAILLLGLAMIGLVRQMNELVSGADPDIREYAEIGPFELPTELLQVRSRLPDSFLMMCVTNSCAACHDRLRELSQMDDPSVVVVTTSLLDPVIEIPTNVLAHVVTDEEFESFGVYVTPFAAIVRRDSIEATGAVGSAETLKAMLEELQTADALSNGA